MIILLSMHETDQHQDLLELLVLDLVRQELDVLSEKKENLQHCLLKANSKVTFYMITSL